MPPKETVIRFEEVSYEYGHNKPILDTVDISVQRGMKAALMGQNGAGKSTLFSLITGESVPESGIINISRNATIALGRQTIPRPELELTVREFFEKCFKEKQYDIDPKIDAVLDVVNLKADHDRKVRAFSGGQQARLLLASALIQDPDILLLDEPTNNLDHAGVEHLTEYLKQYKKTCIVISHDAEFLNAFTDTVFYLDAHTRKVERYIGNYKNALEQIAARIEKENRLNARLAKEIQDNKDKANYFAQKGGKMRLVAKKMRAQIEEAEEEKVDIRKEDKTIRPFTIPGQEGLSGEVFKLSAISRMVKGRIVSKKVNVSLRRGQHLLLKGPNGIGKTSLLERLANGTEKGATLAPGLKIGYYRQDFSTLDFDMTAYDALKKALGKNDEEKIRALGAGFLLYGEALKAKIGSLSEGQKGLVAFASLVLERPGLLILDEPTNHINFRHLPVIAKALDSYEGAMILVSHVPEFVAQIRIDEELDLGK